MGFRSMFMTADAGIDWPAEFVEKHQKWVNFPTRNGKVVGAISSKHESKFYGGTDEDIIQEIAVIVRDQHVYVDSTFEIVFLHECGGVSKFDIRADRIDSMKPIGWEDTEGSTGHDYCYGCSELQRP